jgi:peptidoglycan/LPS O-acetylase OafA/YrhL
MMGEVLLALGFSGLVAAVAGVVNGWVAAGYTGVLCAVVVMMLCVGQFVRRRWPGLLFWFGAALGAAVAQGLVLLTHADAPELGALLAAYGAIGAVLGMLPGGMAADMWQDRRDPQSSRVSRSR